MEDENRFIMLIDDNDITLESVSEALQLHGFQNHMFNDPHRAVAAYNPTLYPIIIVDYNMPGMTGIEVLQEIRKQAPDAKVIIYTGLPDARVRRRIIQSGADEFYKTDKLQQLIEKLEIMIDEIKEENNQ